MHVIFSTKDRKAAIDESIRERLFAYMAGVVNELNGRALTVNGVSDHVHMLAAVPATMAVADFVRTVKANASKWVHEEWPERTAFAWQTGYAAFSVSMSVSEDVKAYIARQEEHHRKFSFKDEFVAFLKRHGMQYDERYIWT
jgi:REP element-mobilizing transposase RayT